MQIWMKENKITGWNIERVEIYNTPTHRIRVSVICREIYQCWNWYGSNLRTLEDQAHQVFKKFHDVDPR